ncbi:hypothetical protein [Bauldia sp.]|uniref:hypothetical protein n=1 Tax=Bauldia sp. TaxID=2575872 RepID=UPI003BADA353
MALLGAEKRGGLLGDIGDGGDVPGWYDPMRSPVTSSKKPVELGTETGYELPEWYDPYRAPLPVGYDQGQVRLGPANYWGMLRLGHVPPFVIDGKVAKRIDWAATFAETLGHLYGGSAINAGPDGSVPAGLHRAKAPNKAKTGRSSASTYTPVPTAHPPPSGQTGTVFEPARGPTRGFPSRGPIVFL